MKGLEPSTCALRTRKGLIPNSLKSDLSSCNLRTTGFLYDATECNKMQGNKTRKLHFDYNVAPYRNDGIIATLNHDYNIDRALKGRTPLKGRRPFCFLERPTAWTATLRGGKRQFPVALPSNQPSRATTGVDHVKRKQSSDRQGIDGAMGDRRNTPH